MANKEKNTGKKIVENKNIEKKGNAQKSKKSKTLIVSILLILIVILIVIMGYIIYEANLIEPNSNSSDNTNIPNDYPVNTPVTQQDYLNIVDYKQLGLILTITVENNTDEIVIVKKVILNSTEFEVDEVVQSYQDESLSLTIVKSIAGMKYFYNKNTSYFIIEVNGIEMIEYFEKDLEGIIS